MREERLRYTLHGFQVDAAAGPVAADPDAGIVPETIGPGTPAWQRARQIAEQQRNKRRRGGH